MSYDFHNAEEELHYSSPLEKIQQLCLSTIADRMPSIFIISPYYYCGLFVNCGSKINVFHFYSLPLTLETFKWIVVFLATFK